MLTDKEKEEIAALKVGFNVVPENKDYVSLAYRRVDLSRTTAKKLLKLSFIFNCISIGFFILTILFSFIKPPPEYYTSTPSGKVFGPLKKDSLK